MRWRTPQRIAVAGLTGALIAGAAVVARDAETPAVAAAPEPVWLAGPSWSEERRDAPPSVRVPYAAPPRLTCGGGLTFRSGALRRPRGYERSDGPLPRALRRFLRRSARDVGQPRSGWFLLARRGGRAEVAAGGLPELGHMAFERREGRWEWAGSGGCRPRASHRGREAVTWRRDPAEAPPADGTRIPVLVEEDACAGGRDAHGRVLRPLVHYGRRTLTVTYFIRPLGGVRTCQGVPPTKVMLVLDEPLAGRRLRDGGPHPPRRRP